MNFSYCKSKSYFDGANTINQMLHCFSSVVHKVGGVGGKQLKNHGFSLFQTLFDSRESEKNQNLFR